MDFLTLQEGQNLLGIKYAYLRLRGEVGLKDLHSWNRAHLARQLWLLLCESGSLWNAWVKEVLLNGRNFWLTKANASLSWNWKKLLSLRDTFRPLVKCCVGNGDQILLWLDN